MPPEIARLGGGRMTAAMIASPAPAPGGTRRVARQALRWRPATNPAVAGTIGKDRALESADKYAIRIDRLALARQNIKILFPDLV
jgi:hypothetical protein